MHIDVKEFNDYILFEVSLVFTCIETAVSTARSRRQTPSNVTRSSAVGVYLLLSSSHQIIRPVAQLSVLILLFRA